MSKARNNTLLARDNAHPRALTALFNPVAPEPTHYIISHTHRSVRPGTAPNAPLSIKVGLVRCLVLYPIFLEGCGNSRGAWRQATNVADIVIKGINFMGNVGIVDVCPPGLHRSSTGATPRCHVASINLNAPHGMLVNVRRDDLVVSYTFCVVSNLQGSGVKHDNEVSRRS